MGVECSVRNQCLCYTDGIGATIYDGTLDKYIRKCTNQKRFMQDSKNVKKGG